jgi:predicted nucleic acid-binding protein
VKGIVDAGVIVAFLNRHDVHHDWAVSLVESVEEPLLTVDVVLAEAAFHVESVMSVQGLISAGLIKVDFNLNQHLERIKVLDKRYADRAPDLADICLICLSEREPKLLVITVDSDFLIYRRHQRERIPVIMP